MPRHVKGNPNWGRAIDPDSVQPAAPSAWELMLAREGMRGEADALAVLAVGGAAAARIAEWVRKHGRQRFVPLDVLAEVGMVEDEAEG